jgi:hypothetical protein
VRIKGLLGLLSNSGRCCMNGRQSGLGLRRRNLSNQRHNSTAPCARRRGRVAYRRHRPAN